MKETYYSRVKTTEKNHIKCLFYSNDTYIIEVDNRIFLVMKKHISNKSVELTNKKNFEDSNLFEDSFVEDRLVFGGKNSFIVDMQGIKNFINAKLLDFKDYYVRSILKEISQLQYKKYLRVGVSGAPRLKYHPGGEVVEEQLLNGENGGGVSNSISGYLLNENGFSKGELLSRSGKMLEDRMVYSHTAFLEESSKSNTLFYELNPNSEVEFMDQVKTLADNLGFVAFCVQTIIKATEQTSFNIKGRVLKRKPKKKFSGLEDATEIGNEKIFKLEKGQKLLVVGTYYCRKDADWFDFTNGREYERKGHYHARVLQDCSDFQHEVFHLRELNIPKNTVVPFIITPINQIVKITPVEEKDGVYFCSVTGKNLNTLIEEFKDK